MKKLVLAWMLTFAVSLCAQQPPPGIDAYVEKVMSTFQVPGVAVTIVKDGKVVLAKGYGVKKLGAADKVDGQTLFAIASNSKVFTATALGLLVEEGKVEWDAPVIRYLPWFRLSDPYVTKELTIRDLLVHRSGLGLGAGDLLWWPPSTYNREEIARRLQHIPLETSFRSAYAYDNVLYLVAGLVIEKVSGKSWEDFITRRILEPVGMSGSEPGHSDIEKAANAATPHAEVEGKVRPVAPFTSDNTNPAGGVVTNARDIAKWMQVNLDSGRISQDRRLYHPSLTSELQAVVTPLRAGPAPAALAPLGANFRGYGLGLFLSDYRGLKFVTHTGGLPGFVSKVTLIPEKRLGVAILTNQESGEAFMVLTHHILDHYLGAKDTDWLKAFAQMRDAQKQQIAEAEKKTEADRAKAGPSLSLETYAGTYRDAWYGDVVIEVKDGKGTIRFAHTPSLVGDFEHWQYDTFVTKWHDRELRADAFVTFSLEPDGSIRDVRMKAMSPATDFSFDFQDLLLKPVKP
jgi:CubicO group peptidase (beta-lactamase class C family)